MVETRYIHSLENLKSTVHYYYTESASANEAHPQALAVFFGLPLFDLRFSKASTSSGTSTASFSQGSNDLASSFENPFHLTK